MAPLAEITVTLPRWRVMTGLALIKMITFAASMRVVTPSVALAHAERIGEWIAQGAKVR